MLQSLTWYNYRDSLRFGISMDKHSPCGENPSIFQKVHPKTSSSTKSLVVWTINGFYFSIYIYIGNVIIPTDELIFFRGLGIPPTSFGIGFQGFSHGKPDGLGKLQHSEPSFRGGFGLVCSSPARLGDSAIPGTR